MAKKSTFENNNIVLSIGVLNTTQGHVGISMNETDAYSGANKADLHTVLTKQEAISLAHDLLAMAESIKGR